MGHVGRTLAVSLIMVLGSLVGCSGQASGPTVSSHDQMEAEQVFRTRCSTCHGMQGRGDGPGSAGLNPHPRDFTDHSWQASVDDRHISQIIQFGGTAVGLPAAMPPNPDLQTKPGVVAGLVVKVRSLGQ